MLAKPALDELLDPGDALVEGHHLLGQGMDQLRDGLLPRDGGVLPFGGLNYRFSQGFGVSDLTLGQPLRQSGDTCPADRCRGLVAGEQDQRADVGQLQGPFQGGEHAQQRAAQAVHRAGAVLDQVGPAAGQQLQIDRGLVAGADRPQVAADAGLIGDHVGIAGIGLALTAVAVTGPVDQAAGEVKDLLLVGDEQGQQQRRLAAGHVDGPGHLVSTGQGQDVADELEQLGLVVGDPPRQQGPAVGVQGQAVVVALPAVDPGPDSAHRAPDVLVRAVRTTDDLAGIALLSDLLALPNRRPSRRGVPGGEAC